MFSLLGQPAENSMLHRRLNRGIIIAVREVSIAMAMVKRSAVVFCLAVAVIMHSSAQRRS